jgi:hypothetical protein
VDADSLSVALQSLVDCAHARHLSADDPLYRDVSVYPAAARSKARALPNSPRSRRRSFPRLVPIFGRYRSIDARRPDGNSRSKGPSLSWWSTGGRFVSVFESSSFQGLSRDSGAAAAGLGRNSEAPRLLRDCVCHRASERRLLYQRKQGEWWRLVPCGGVCTSLVMAGTQGFEPR